MIYIIYFIEYYLNFFSFFFRIFNIIINIIFSHQLNTSNLNAICKICLVYLKENIFTSMILYKIYFFIKEFLNK